MFHSARINLTAWYLMIIMMISLMFSAAIYHALTQEVERFARGQRFFIERRLRNNHFPPEVLFDDRMRDIPIMDDELVYETKHRILILLGGINGAILILSGALGYILAGRTLRPIRDMVEEQNRFISDASHELKTPLTSLKSTFEVHLRNPKRTVQEADLVVRESIQEVNKLQYLTESLLALAHHVRPNGQKIMENIRLDEIIQVAVKKVSPMAAKKNITIETNASDVTVHGNKYTLPELFVTLLDNAIKYSEIKSSISIDIKTHERTVSVIVSDQGAGIAAADLPHIFDRFYRADAARTKTHTNGYGLGLAIARKIANDHNGKITVKSTVGKGTVFTIRLPIAFS